MRITGARVAVDANRSGHRDLTIREGRISLERTPDREEPELDLSGFLLLPGLVNAHDHLEFNLFPRLGSAFYPNAKSWAGDIYRPHDSPVREHLSLSKRARLMWGGLKNLLSGVTTVAHHNPVDDPFLNADFPVHVVRQFGWAHSLDFGADVLERFRATPEDWPFVVHAAEGVDERATSEIAQLDLLGVLCERTVLIHAIGLDHPGLELVKRRNSGIVWCPTSNLSIYGRTLSASALHSGLNIGLGTDSAMTAQTDLIDEIAMARRVSDLGRAGVYEMVTTRPARLLRLRDGQGEIGENGVADLVAVRDRGQTPAEALEAMTPEMVIVGGVIRLISPPLRERVNLDHPIKPHRSASHSVALEGRGRWFTSVDVPALHQETLRVLGPEYRLAGKRVSL